MATLDEAVKNWGSEARAEWSEDIRLTMDRHQEHTDGMLEDWGVGNTTAEARAFLLGASMAFKTTRNMFESTNVEFWHPDVTKEEGRKVYRYDRTKMVDDVTELLEFQGAVQLVMGDAALRYESAATFSEVVTFLYEGGEGDGEVGPSAA